MAHKISTAANAHDATSEALLLPLKKPTSPPATSSTMYTQRTVFGFMPRLCNWKPRLLQQRLLLEQKNPILTFRHLGRHPLATGCWQFHILPRARVESNHVISQFVLATPKLRAAAVGQVNNITPAGLGEAKRVRADQIRPRFQFPPLE